MRTVPWWAVVSAALAPILLIGGWTIAAALQPAGYDAGRDTISALAGLGATDRVVMTATFVGVGVGHAATLALAAFPVPAVGVSAAHRLVAAIALGALAIWPALAARTGSASGLRPADGALFAGSPDLTVALAATAVLLTLLGVFAVQLALDGDRVGLTERLVTGAQALWPLVVVLCARGAARGARPD